jgi:hypothetical protein
MNQRQLTTIRPLRVIVERAFAIAAYRHQCHASDSTDDRFAAVVMRSSKRLTG